MAFVINPHFNQDTAMQLKDYPDKTRESGGDGGIDPMGHRLPTEPLNILAFGYIPATCLCRGLFLNIPSRLWPFGILSGELRLK